MVSPAADSGGAGEEERGRTAYQLHQPWDDHRDHLARGDVHSIAQRLDGVYQGAGDIEDVHGWYYADPSSGALPQVDSKAT